MTKRKLLPALSNLKKEGKLAEDFEVIGIGRRDLKDTFAKELEEDFAKIVTYYQMDFLQESEYPALVKFLEEKNCSDSVFFLSVAPEFYGNIAKSISGFKNSTVIVEKPFGYDLETSEILNKELVNYLQEEQIYRIDHYLGKDSVRNLPRINTEEVSYVQITAKEDIGIEGRGPFYEKAGALRDMVQNHMMEVTAQILRKDGNIREEKARALKTLVIEEAVNAQYESYRSEDRVSKDSNTETYAFLKLVSGELPIYIRTGKKLDKKQTSVFIKYKDGREKFYDLRKGNVGNGYDELLLSAIKKDNKLFVPYETVEATWKLLTPLLLKWEKETPVFYKDGTDGPKEVDEILKKDGLTWHE